MDVAAATAFTILPGKGALPGICAIVYPYAGHIFTFLVHPDLFKTPRVPNYRARRVSFICRK